MGRISLSLLFGGALALVFAAGCASPTSAPAGPGGDLLVFESEEIEIFPDSEKEVKVKSGKAESAEAPKDSGLTAKVEDGKVKISAGKDAKEGEHKVTVKGGKKDATIKVKVKKKEE
jgi:hypothetical protein